MIKGEIHAVCASPERGTAKERISEGILVEGRGLSGDAHFGFYKRHVSLLALERIEALNEEAGIGAVPGSFAENITTRGVDLSAVPVGAEARLGSARIRITGRGKPEHGPGDYSFHGHAPLAREGLFAEVVESGHIAEGDEIVFG